MIIIHTLLENGYPLGIRGLTKIRRFFLYGYSADNGADSGYIFYSGSNTGITLSVSDPTSCHPYMNPPIFPSFSFYLIYLLFNPKQKQKHLIILLSPTFKSPTIHFLSHFSFSLIPIKNLFHFPI